VTALNGRGGDQGGRKPTLPAEHKRSKNYSARLSPAAFDALENQILSGHDSLADVLESFGLLLNEQYAKPEPGREPKHRDFSRALFALRNLADGLQHYALTHDDALRDNWEDFPATRNTIARADCEEFTANIVDARRALSRACNQL